MSPWHTPGTPTATSTYADERGRPFVELVARVGAAAPATVVDLGCGPGNLTALLAERWPAAEVRGRRQQPRDDRQGPRVPPRDRLRDRRRAGLARRPSPSTSWSPTPPCSGCPATSTCCPACWPRSGPAAGWPSRCPATSTSPATPSAPSWPPRRRTTRTPRGVAVPDRARRRRPTSRCSPASAATSTPGRPRTSTCCRRGPGVHLGQRHRRPAHAPGAARRPAPGFEEEFRARLRAAYPATDGRVVLPFRRVFVVARTPR